MGTKGVNDYPGSRLPRNRSSKKPKRIDDPFSGIIPTIYVMNGVRTEVFTIGQVAKVLNKKPVTLRAWEKKEILPKATYRTPAPQGVQVPGKTLKGRRIYTRKQVDLLLQAVDLFIGDLHPTKVPTDNWNKLKQYLKDNWKK